MPRSFLVALFAALFNVLLGLFSRIAAQDTAPATTPATTQTATKPAAPVIGECLVIESFSHGGRQAISADPVAAAIVSGSFRAPVDGDIVRSADGREHRWRKIDSNESVYSDDALAGGWAYVPVDSPDERIAMLCASGHGVVYVNTEPRAGDPYETGYVRLPILLTKGRNDLLFTGGRGRLRVEIIEPKSSVFFDTADATLPDFIAGEKDQQRLAVVVVNATTQPVSPRITVNGGETYVELMRKTPEERLAARGRAGVIPPLSVRKQRLALTCNGEDASKLEATLSVEDELGRSLDTTILTCRTCKPGETHKRTFLSSIDDSVQYYSIVPQQPPPKTGADEKPALVLSLHGASVEATSQAAAYSSKSWCHIVCPTNRRPFGFDWEDWGRIDALEVLDRAETLLDIDPTRVYLTGHSMGGHGTWQLGSLFPDRFAAIGPSAGWLSFATYGRTTPATTSTSGPATQSNATRITQSTTSTQPSMVEIFRRAAATSDTPALMSNLGPRGIYILHGVDDDNVPVSQARQAASILEKFHRDFTIFEQPKVGHWWDISDEPGADCVDWREMFDYFARHRLPRAGEVREIDFRTVNPGVSSRCHWIAIDAQIRPMVMSRATVRFDPQKSRIIGTTENVARLLIDLTSFYVGAPIGMQVQIELDGKSPGIVPLAENENRIWLHRDGDAWTIAAKPSPAMKSAARSGPFKRAFDNRMIFVYGTQGTGDENAATYAKARFDAETWWYRGNGSVDVIADSEFDPTREKNRNVILYGNATTNGSWSSVIADSPIAVSRGQIRIGDREFAGDDLACLFVRPRANDDKAIVGVVASTGPAGMRLAGRLPYFSSGVGYPDWCVLGEEMLTQGIRRARAAGYFGNDWKLSAMDTVWGE